MTEAEWLTSEDPQPMIKIALGSPRASDRVPIVRRGGVGLDSAPVPEKTKAPLVGPRRGLGEWADTGTLPEAIRSPGARRSVYLGKDAREAVRTAVTLDPAPSERDKVWCLQAAIVREVFGNPFRPVAPDPSWLTSDVLALARGIYEKKAFDRMPILADALQDADCTNEDVLSHCRSEQTHVRGCWVLDLLLGKR